MSSSWTGATPPRIPMSLNAADGYVDLLEVGSLNAENGILSTNVVASGYVLGGTTTVPVGLVNGLSDGTMKTTAGVMSGAVSIGTGSLTATGAVSGLTVGATTTVTGGTGVTATTGNVVATAGNLQAGSSAHAGTVGSFPAAATSGELLLAAVTNAGGNFNTTISNASSVAQSQVVSIPDSGDTTANFIVSKSGSTQTISTGSLALTLGTVTAEGHIYSGKTTFTQLTNPTTAVPITTYAGTIVTFTLGDGAGTRHSFNITGSVIATSSLIKLELGPLSTDIVTHGVPYIEVTSVGAGTAAITITNIGANAFTGTLTFYYQII